MIQINDGKYFSDKFCPKFIKLKENHQAGHFMIANPIGFLFSPSKQWREAAKLDAEHYLRFTLYPLILAVLPSVAWYYGITVTGWGVGSGDDVTRLTQESALRVVVAFYFTMVISICVVGYAISWMAKTYGVETSISKGISVSAFAATPMFIIGLVGVYPLLWLDLSLGIIALGWSIYLLYTGIPTVMHMPKEQGFLYTSAIIAVCCVILMCIMGGTVILWEYGFMPVFTD